MMPPIQFIADDEAIVKQKTLKRQRQEHDKLRKSKVKSPAHDAKLDDRVTTHMKVVGISVRTYI